jgi:phosphoribosyl 1,2-cyclic phosphodiesterase
MGSETQSDFAIRFRGVRGSFPTPSAANLRYGGNTPCVEVVRPHGRARIVLDAGTGIHPLGHSLLEHEEHDVHILLSHFHWDHIQGLPGFPLLYKRGNTVTYYSSHGRHEMKRVLEEQMREPYFPVAFDALHAEQNFVHLAHPMEIDGVQVTPFALHHPGGSTGFRLESGGKTIVYATDHEHGHADADARLLEAAQGADVLVYDAQYTPETYPKRVGWGHSTWLEGAKLAAEAGVKQLVLFHHDPHHGDEAMDAIVAAAREHFANTVAASEGLVL